MTDMAKLEKTLKTKELHDIVDKDEKKSFIQSGIHEMSKVFSTGKKKHKILSPSNQIDESFEQREEKITEDKRRKA